MPLPNKELRVIVAGICASTTETCTAENLCEFCVKDIEKIVALVADPDKALLTQAFAAVRPEDKAECEHLRSYGSCTWYDCHENGGFNTALADYDQNVKKYLEEMK
jgi:hypothetical protein